MTPLIQNSDFPGLIFLYFAMINAMTPTPPFDTPCLRRTAIPVPKKIDPNNRSSETVENGESKDTSNRLTEIEVTVIPKRVPIVLLPPRKCKANNNMDAFMIQRARLNGIPNQ